MSARSRIAWYKALRDALEAAQPQTRRTAEYTLDGFASGRLSGLAASEILRGLVGVTFPVGT